MVTADDVELAVEVAEKLWAEALEAREKADKLATDAEEMTVATESDTAAAAKSVGSVEAATKLNLSMLGDAQKAMSASLEVGEVLADAFDADEEASRLEELAEAALAASEKAIEQHLIDFPDSELADEL